MDTTLFYLQESIPSISYLLLCVDNKACKCAFPGVVGVRGGGKHNSLHHQRAPEPRPGSPHGCPQQPSRCRGAVCPQVQHPLCSGELLRSCQGGGQCTQGTASVPLRAGSNNVTLLTVQLIQAQTVETKQISVA